MKKFNTRHSENNSAKIKEFFSAIKDSDLVKKFISQISKLYNLSIFYFWR